MVQTAAGTSDSLVRPHIALAAGWTPQRHGLPVEAQRVEARDDVLEIRAAQSASERSAANRLIERMYATRGYNATPLPARDSATMRTFVATDCSAPVGTLTVRLDSAQGLAADELFPDEVGRFRAEGARVCEFTKLAMDRSARSPRLLASLFHVAYLLAHRLHGCRYLIIEVNPRHVRYYETMLGFARVGGPRHNQRVDAPAVLLALDLRHAKEQIGRFGGRPELSATERSAYPYFFAPDEEAPMLDHLARVDHEVTRVLDLTTTHGEEAVLAEPELCH